LAAVVSEFQTYPGRDVRVLVVRMVRPGPSRKLHDERDHVQDCQQKRVEKFLKKRDFKLKCLGTMLNDE